MLRRKFLKFFSLFFAVFLYPKMVLGNLGEKTVKPGRTGGKGIVYRSVLGKPAQNVRKALELMGGMERFVKRDDVVLVKPNGQWWNQGGTNLACLKAFVDQVFGISGGFEGEVVLAENCHLGPEPWGSARSAWAADFERNSDLPGCQNLLDLANVLKEKYGSRFSCVHWIDVSSGGRRTKRGGEEGYVYCDGNGTTEKLFFTNGLEGKDARKTMATYPVFKTDRGTLVDFKQGVFRKGRFQGDALIFVNFPALNHHSTYAGMTSCLKNYMGITDLSGGPDPHEGGQLQPGIFNYHSFPFNRWEKGPVPGMLGAEMGFFMNHVRRADLNIVSAQWTGLSSRTDLPAARTQAVIASTDPVALDYHAAKYVLYPNSKVAFHNPDWKEGPLYQYLEACAKMTGDALDDSGVEVISWNIEKDRLQEERELAVRGERFWGSNPKLLAKYVALRYLPFLFN